MQQTLIRSCAGVADCDTIAVPGPTLPTELLIKIAEFVAQTSTPDSVQFEPRPKVDYSTLRALCLTSRTVSEIATPLLYRHLVLPTPEAGHALARTLGGARWQAGDRAGKAAQWVRTVSLGQPIWDAGDESEDDFVVEVLGLLSGVRLERVAVVGVWLGAFVFEWMQSKPSLR